MDVPTGDFWLFDDTELFGMRYDADGMWLGVERLTDQAATLAARRGRDATLRLAQPWATYIDSQPELARRAPVALWQD